jgi:hemerythrin-like domain-containing protein
MKRPARSNDPRWAARPPLRRDLLGAGAAFGLTAFAASREAAAKKTNSEKVDARGGEEDVGPGEDLMREHGVLRRVLLVYGEIGRRLEAGTAFDVGALRDSAAIIRTFVEDYHERQEEDFVFPRFERANKLVELVHVLRAQHQAGRKVTERVQAAAKPSALSDPAERRRLHADLLAFIRMYEPHAAREDTVLLPALHQIVSRSEYDALGEDFERRERAIFGGDGFEHAVARVDAIEKTLGIEDLAQFTPPA